MDGDDDALLGHLLKLSEYGSSGSDVIRLLTPDETWSALRASVSDGGDLGRRGGEPNATSSTLNSSGGDAGADGFPVHWREGLLSISAVLRLEPTSAFDVHLAASQAVPLGLEEVGSNDEAQLSSEATNYVVLCVLLCCWALQLHERDASALQKRPKRWQSLVVETLRLFQRHCTNSTDSGVLTTVWIPLWVQHVLPTTVRLQRCLLSCSISKSASATASDPNLVTSLRSNDVAFLSAIVAVSSTLARRCCQATMDLVTQQTIKLNLESLLRALWDPLEGCFNGVLWCHPWRQRFGDTEHVEEGTNANNAAFRNLHSALSYWSVTHEEEDGAFAMVDTQWDSRGVAALATVADECCRDYVSSPVYMWKTWFPHVATLLDDGSDHEGDADSEDSESGPVGDGQIHFHRLGFQLLNNALQKVPSFSLACTCPVAYSVASRLPDDPIGVLQLLSNRLLASSVESRTDRVPSQQQLPVGAEIFKMMRSLLAKYKPECQIRIVRVLVKDCPHPGLHSKLLDLLRPFVSWDDSQAVLGVWQYVNEILDRLETHFEPTQVEASPRYVELDELLDSIEFYVSSLSLIYLWIRVKGWVPEVPMLSSRLSSIYDHLHASRTHDDERYFRLHLLESALEQNIEALSMQR